MSYTYGTKGAPAVGGGVPGLPQRIQATQSTYTRIVSGSGVLIPPQNAVYMRVAVIGGGGGGRGTSTSGNKYAGGGGGCAASKIVAASPVAYSIGAGGDGRLGTSGNGTNGGDTTASFAGYKLVGGGGTGGTTTSGAGGVGSGGDYNFNGGDGRLGASTSGAAGGGGAGPNGDGATFSTTPTNGPFSNTGWGAGGGGIYVSASSGHGAGVTNAAISTATDAPMCYPWGGPEVNGHGGEMGGGGKADYNATTGSIASDSGGSGGMVVEWFY